MLGALQAQCHAAPCSASCRTMHHHMQHPYAAPHAAPHEVPHAAPCSTTCSTTGSAMQHHTQQHVAPHAAPCSRHAEPCSTTCSHLQSLAATNTALWTSHAALCSITSSAMERHVHHHALPCAAPPQCGQCHAAPGTVKCDGIQATAALSLPAGMLLGAGWAQARRSTRAPSSCATGRT